MKSLTKLWFVALAVFALTACVTSGSIAQLWNNTYQFYPSQGYVDTHPVYYLMTDVSDADFALKFTGLTGFAINYAPKLANALSPAIRVNSTEFMPSVYNVTNVPIDAPFQQKLIFSTEWPGSYPPKPGDYMPLWRLQTVTWNNPANAVPLKSVGEIEANEGTGPYKLTIQDAGVVVGASIVINSNRVKIEQAYVSYASGYPLVRLPIRAVFIDGAVYKTLQLDFSNTYASKLYKGTYSPLLAKFYMSRLAGVPVATQKIYSLWPKPPVTQLNVAQTAPNPFGYKNNRTAYSPLMNEWTATSAGPFSGVFTSETAIKTAIPSFRLNPTTYVAYQPVIGR